MYAWYIAHQKLCAESRDLFKLWEISDTIALTVQDRGIVGNYASILH